MILARIYDLFDLKKQLLKEIIHILKESSIVGNADLTFCSSPFNCSVKVAFSDYFWIQVKDKNDLSDLYEVMQETNTLMIEEETIPEMPDWFLIRVTKNSKGNAMQMANYFYETGKFKATDRVFNPSETIFIVHSY